MESTAPPFDVQYLILEGLSQCTQSLLSKSDWQSIVNAMCVCRESRQLKSRLHQLTETGLWYDSLRKLLIQNHPAWTLLEVCKPAGQFALEQLAADYTTRESAAQLQVQNNVEASHYWVPVTYSAKLYRSEAKAADGDGDVEDALAYDLRNCMCIAAYQGDVDSLSIALKTGVDPEDSFPLYVIKGGHISVLELLLDGGYIDIKAKTCGKSLLAEAILYDKVDVVAFLLARGADMNIRVDTLIEDTEISLNPVSCATSRNNVEMVKILVSHGAELEDPGADDRPIWWAIFHRNIDMARLFIENGVNLSPGMLGEWPLYEAVMMGHAEMVMLMLEAGGMPKDASDVTHLYHKVVISRNPEIHEIFGVDPAESR